MRFRNIAALLAALLLGAGGARAQTTPSLGPQLPGFSELGALALPPGFTHFPYVNPDAPKGGTVHLAALGSFDSLNPFILRGTPASGVEKIWDTLLRASADEAGAAYGLLAQSIEVAPDHLSVAFNLRPEARFADNTPVTAADVVWTFNALRSQGRPFYRAYYGDVADVQAAGPLRVVFRFKTAQNRELPLIIGEMPILPAHWWQGRDFSKPLTDAPLGSGPYEVDHVAFGRSIIYRLRPDYWARDLPEARGLDNFATIDTEYFRDATVAMQAFKAGQIDFRAENISKNWATAYDFPAVAKGWVKREELAYHLPSGMQGFAMNTRRPIFHDPLVRHALALAFDFEWMNKNLFYGAYVRSLSYFANSDLASSGVPQGAALALLEPFRAALPADLFTTPFALPVTDGSGNNRAQLRAALALLMQAGWVVRDRKLVDAQGQQMQFTILLDDPTYERVALPYVQSLDRLGIAVQVRTVDPSQYQHLLDNFDFDMTMAVFPASDVPGNELQDEWSCDAAKSPGSSNITGACSEAIDALIGRVISAPDRPQLQAAAQALDAVLLSGWYLVPNWHTSVLRVAYWNMFGHPAAPVRAGLVFDSWWIDPARLAVLNAARGSTP